MSMFFLGGEKEMNFERGTELERVLRTMKRKRRVVPRSTTNEYLELVLGTANGVPFYPCNG